MDNPCVICEDLEFNEKYYAGMYQGAKDGFYPEECINSYRKLWRAILGKQYIHIHSCYRRIHFPWL